MTQPVTRLHKARMEAAIASYEAIIRTIEVWQSEYSDVFPVFTKDISAPKHSLITYLEMMESIGRKTQIEQ